MTIESPMAAPVDGPITSSSSAVPQPLVLLLFPAAPLR
jgi:hypothetical protein